MFLWLFLLVTCLKSKQENECESYACSCCAVSTHAYKECTEGHMCHQHAWPQHLSHNPWVDCLTDGQLDVHVNSLLLKYRLSTSVIAVGYLLAVPPISYPLLWHSGGCSGVVVEYRTCNWQVVGLSYLENVAR